MKNNLLKLLLLFIAICSSMPQVSAQTFNYGEALQKSLFFYEAQQSGELPDWNRVSWRADSALGDGSDVGLDLTGGWYDAGDHVKFGFPMAFSVTALAWGALEYEDAYRRSGQLDILKRNLRYVTDYFIKCHTAPNEFYGQLGNGGIDHAFWGSPEVMIMDRPAYKIDAANPGSDLASETAAAMAAVSILLKDDDPAYSALLVRHAKELYSFADNFRGEYSSSITDAAGFYRSFSSYKDEIVWGAAWLYRATNEQEYLTKAEAEYDNLNNEGQSADKAYKFTMSWDDKGYGSYVLLAQLTGKDKYKQDAERYLDFWTSGVNGERVTYSPGGQAHLIQWGSLRYAANTSFLALVYSDKVETSAANKAKYHDFAVGQVNYALGDNPINRSFMIGFGNNPANNSHHRSAHGAWGNSLRDRPDLPSHTLFGALVGGPSSPDDSFVDDRGDFIANEVACDYNACFTGVLARMYDEFGGNPLSAFPPADTPTRAEIRSFSRFNSNNNFGSTISINVQNRTAWPARATDKLSYRYYFDIAEGIAAGNTIADYDFQLNGLSSGATMNIVSTGGSTYYAEISNLPSISPIGDPQFRTETQINIRVQNGVPYDTSNDWSAIGLSDNATESTNIPVYDNGVLVFGSEPNGTTPVVNGGTISGGPFTFTVDDGIADNVSGITLSGNVGPNSQWVVTDDQNNILGLPASPEDVDFDGAGTGICLIWHLSFEDGLTGAAVGNNVSALNGVYDLSNSITVTRNPVVTNPTVDGGVISGGPFTFTVGDGNADNVSGVTLTGNVGPNSQWVVTDDQNNILGLPSTPEEVDFDGAGEGVCLIWHLSFEDGLTGAIAGNNVSALNGVYDLSNSITVNRIPEAPIGGGDDCKFGTPISNALPSINAAFENIFVLGSGGPNLDNVTNFTINWDLANNGLYQFSMSTNNGVPSWYNDFLPNVSQNFNASQPDITITGSGIAGLDGAYWVTIDQNNVVLVSKSGSFTLYFSTSATTPDCGTSVPAVDGGVLTGGPFTFTVGDGIADNVSGITLSGNVGPNSQWVVTDDQNNILGLPASPEDVDFDGAGIGICLIWHLSFEDGLTGAAVGNNVSALNGVYDLSNSITVTRNPVVTNPTVDGGVISGGPFTFTVGDGNADNVSGVTLTGNVGPNSQWVVTDDQNNILGLPSTPEEVDFDGAGEGVCLIWHLSFEDGLTGAIAGNNVSALNGVYDLSNSITVNRIPEDPIGGGDDCKFGTPISNALPSINAAFENIFVLGSGGPNLDNVTNFTINWDLANNGLYQFSMSTNNGVPSWYNDFLPNVSQNFNASQPDITITGSGIAGLDGAYWVTIDQNNVVLVSKSGSFTLYFSTSATTPDCGTSVPAVDGGVISGGPFTFTVGDGIADNVSGITLSGNVGPNSQWVVTDDQNNILGLPASPEDVDFDGAGIGICLIWHLSFEDGLTGATAGNNVSELNGVYDLSNSITVNRNSVTSTTNGGTVATNTGSTSETTITGDGTADVINFTTTSTSTEAYIYLITDDQGNILVTETDSHDFEGATVGVCRVYGLSYTGTLDVAGKNISANDLSSDEFSVSTNFITVTREDTTTGGGGGGGSSDNAYIDRFIEMRDEFYDPENGYFSADGSPHHSIESLIVEAPDHGHESTSELYSYWLWLEVMHGRITGDWQPLSDVWDRIEEFIIPTNADQPSNAAYNPNSPAAYAPEFPLPTAYPAPLDFNAPTGVDPVSADLTATYGADIYQMHWLLDNDNFYGYGNRGDGVSTPSYINTFQRGEQESVYETIPHPSWEDFSWGGNDGFLPLFTLDANYSQQWRYTSAPDADARAVQAMYWALEYAKEQGVSIGELDLDKATKMGDFLRLGMFDKYFKPLGVQSATSGAGTGYDSAHYLMSWFISWGGSADPASQWAFRISASHCHFGYQNPVAAYALTQVDELKPQSSTGERDWNVSLQRQMEFYTWLQSKEGAIAGGATNSWNGDYSTYPAGKSTFYDMAFDTNPVYEDPGSGTWFGWQAWSMERVAEYYYITNDAMAKNLMDKWASWVKSEVQLIGSDDFQIPATLEWTGEPDTWNPSSPGTNNNLSVTVTDYSRDLGVAASMAKALTYYAAATDKYETLDTEARDLAKEVLDRMWNTYRDDKGVSSPEERGDFARIFEQEVYVPDGYTGVMANGDEIKQGVSFLDIRSGYKNDPDFARLEEAYNNGEAYTQNYHRSWAQIEVALANAEYGFFFGDDGTQSKSQGSKPKMMVGVHPNPASDVINVSILNTSNEVQIRLIDFSGRVVTTKKLENNERSTKLFVQSLPVGLYVLETKAINSNQVSRKKIIIN